MTTQSTTFPEPTVQPARKSSTEARSATDATETAGPGLKAKLQETFDSTKSRVTEWKDGLQDGVRDRPIQSLLIATAVGAVIGLIVGRRSR